MSLMLIFGRPPAERADKHGQPLLGQAVRRLDGIIQAIRTVTLILQLPLGTVAAMSRGRGGHHGSLGSDLSGQGQSSDRLAQGQC